MNYVYIAYTKDKRLVKGKISANSEQIAAEVLANIGYQVLSLKQVVPLLPNLSKYFPTRIKPQDIVLLFRQLALLIDSGVGIVQSLELLREQSTNKTIKKVLKEVASDLRGGNPLSNALAKHPRVFPLLYTRMIAVGEKTGELTTILRSLADYVERDAAVINKLKAALTYPVTVLLLAVGVVILLITIALPPLINLFTSFDAQLPLLTRGLVSVVNFANHYGFYLLLSMGALILLIFTYTRSTSGRYQWDKLMLNLPIIGRLNLLTELSRSCRSLSLLFRTGLPLPEVMNLAKQATRNRVIAVALANVAEQVIKGEGLARSLAKNRLFLPLMVTMTRVGEETGNLDETLITVAQSYEAEAENRMRTVFNLLEPMMLLFLGGLVALIALSMFMPLYGILKSIGVG